MRDILFSLIVCLTLFFSPWIFAQGVSVHSGNIFFKSNDGKEQPLTRNGHDSEPALSGNGKWVVFVREIPTKKDELNPTVLDTPELANELWLIATDSKVEKRLVKYGAFGMKDYRIGNVYHPQFFSDSHRIAFMTSLAVVEGAIYIVDLQNRKIQFVSAGNSLDVVPSGEYKNHLIVQRHKYFLPGGSYDWYWLLDTHGKEIGAIGDEENLKLFKEMYLQQ